MELWNTWFNRKNHLWEDIRMTYHGISSFVRILYDFSAIFWFRLWCQLVSQDAAYTRHLSSNVRAFITHLVKTKTFNVKVIPLQC